MLYNATHLCTLDQEQVLTYPVHIKHVTLLQNNHINLPLVGRHSDTPLDQKVRHFLLLTNLLVAAKEASVKAAI